jgi:RNA polymerase sigma factor (sigma-70 family)
MPSHVAATGLLLLASLGGASLRTDALSFSAAVRHMHHEAPFAAKSSFTAHPRASAAARQNGQRSAPFLVMSTTTRPPRAKKQHTRERETSLGPSISAELKQKRPLLTHAEEIELGYLVNRLVEMERVSAALSEELARAPTRDEWVAAAQLESKEELEAVLRRGRWAKQELIVNNLRLVLSVAYRYISPGVQLSDVVQEGVVALSHAAEKFDPSRGYRFSTYATWWIRQRISKCTVPPNTLSRIPERMYMLVRKADAAGHKLNTIMGRWPSTLELANDLNVTVPQLEAAWGAVQPVYSVDWFPKSSDDKQISYSIVPSHDALPEDVVEVASLRESLEEVMASALSDREREILRMRVGLDDGRGKSLREIGEILQINSRKVRRVRAHVQLSD